MTGKIIAIILSILSICMSSYAIIIIYKTNKIYKKLRKR